MNEFLGEEEPDVCCNSTKLHRLVDLPWDVGLAIGKIAAAQQVYLDLSRVKTFSNPSCVTGFCINISRPKFHRKPAFNLA